jgi:ComF family protein
MGFWAEAALHVLLPRACAHCAEDLAFGENAPLCASCACALPAPPSPGCARCGGRLGARRDFCPGGAGRLFSARLIRAAFSHRGPAESLVHAFKFRGLSGAAREAGRLMAGRFSAFPELSGFDALAPVPLHRRRELERGYNQAELLARELAASTGLPLLFALRRERGGGPTWRLGRNARKAELAGAFAVAPEAAERLPGRRLLLVDDVCATATTLEECARALRRAGAADVAGYCFARAPG